MKNMGKIGDTCTTGTATHSIVCEQAGLEPYGVWRGDKVLIDANRFGLNARLSLVAFVGREKPEILTHCQLMEKGPSEIRSSWPVVGVLHEVRHEN